MPKNKNHFFNFLNRKYVFSIRNDQKFLESTKASLRVGDLISLGVIISLIALGFAYLLFRFTPLSYFLSEDVNEQKQEVFSLRKKTDSLNNILTMNENYFANIQKIVNGEIIPEGELQQIDSQTIENISISDPTEEERKLIESVREREQFTLNTNTEVKRITFIAPVDGVISNEFNEDEQHFGVDIVAPKNSPILATAAGIVIYSSWSELDGHTIILSHPDDYISIYKHNEKLLKKIGDRVQAGEAIAILGNSGENTSGYHVHFELWRNGIPQNTEDFIPNT